MKIQKTTSVQRDALRQLKARGGAVMTSEWTTGTGQHTRARTIPPFCERIYRVNADIYPNRIRRIFQKHPRCKIVVAIVDMRSANRVINSDCSA